VRGGPPVGGTFQFQIFIKGSSPEIWPETIFGSEEVLARKGVAYFWVTSFRKKFIGSRGEAPCVASVSWRGAPGTMHPIREGTGPPAQARRREPWNEFRRGIDSRNCHPVLTAPPLNRK